MNIKTIKLNNEKIILGYYKLLKYPLYRGFIDHYANNKKLYRQVININRVTKEDAYRDAKDHFNGYLIANYN